MYIYIYIERERDVDRGGAMGSAAAASGMAGAV